MRAAPLFLLALLWAFPIAAQDVFEEPYDEEEPGEPPAQVFVDENGNEYVEGEAEGYADGAAEDGYAQQDPYAQQGALCRSGSLRHPRAAGCGGGSALAASSAFIWMSPFSSPTTGTSAPALGLTSASGWELGYIIPQVNLGVATNFLKEEATALLGPNLSSFWATLGVRIQILNPTRFVPFVDAGLRLQLWNYPAPTAGSGYVADEIFFEPGISLGGGLAIELTERIGLDIAACSPT